MKKVKKFAALLLIFALILPAAPTKATPPCCIAARCTEAPCAFHW